MSYHAKGTEVTGDKEGRTYLYKSTLPPVWPERYTVKVAGWKCMYTHVCVRVCADIVSQHVSRSANEVIWTVI